VTIMDNVRALISRKAPAGLLDSNTVQQALEVHGLIYEAVWVKEWPPEAPWDEWAKPRKVKYVKARCSFCGGEDLLQWAQAEERRGGYGFIHPKEHNWTPCASGDDMLCPFCGVPVKVKKKAELGRRGYDVVDETEAMSAAVVGKEHLLALTCWKIQRRVYQDGREELIPIPAEAYVFGAQDCVKLMGWVNSYSGTAGYFIAYSREWRQPQKWSESWGVVSGGIFGLTPELVASSSLPNCKLDVYMEAFQAEKNKFPVAYLRLYQQHPNLENLLVSGLPMVLDDLMYECMPNEKWENNDRGLPSVADIDWDEVIPSKMLGLTREELRMGQMQCWGAMLWRLFVGAKTHGEFLTEDDIRNAFYLGDDQIPELVGWRQVSKSLRYLLKQIERDGPGAEDDYGDPIPEGYIDVNMLLDYWAISKDCGRDLADPQVRWPRNLVDAHDSVLKLKARKKSQILRKKFRERRKALARYIFESDGLIIVPAGSQAELQKEADSLHHCVWTYGEKHCSGESSIFFIRRAAEPDVPYYTLELDENKCEVRQNRGDHNCGKTTKVQAFENLWIGWVQDGAKRDKDGTPVLSHTRKRRPDVQIA